MQYTTEGLDNKREIALTVPTIEPWNESDEIHFGDAGQGRAVAWVRFGETTIDRELGSDEIQGRIDAMPKADQWERVDKKDTGFANPKWNAYYAPGTRGKSGNHYILEGEDGVFEISGSGPIRLATLSNTRFYSLEDAVNALNKALVKASGTKETKRVLVIDEIQSKRHQEGRENGYIDNRPVKAKERRVAEAKTVYDEAVKAVDEYVKSLPNIIATAEEEIKLNELKATIGQFQEQVF
jgi:hypothetical protein